MKRSRGGGRGGSGGGHGSGRGGRHGFRRGGHRGGGGLQEVGVSDPYSELVATMQQAGADGTNKAAAEVAAKRAEEQRKLLEARRAEAAARKRRRLAEENAVVRADSQALASAIAAQEAVLRRDEPDDAEEQDMDVSQRLRRERLLAMDRFLNMPSKGKKSAAASAKTKAKEGEEEEGALPAAGVEAEEDALLKEQRELEDQREAEVTEEQLLAEKAAAAAEEAKEGTQSAEELQKQTEEAEKECERVLAAWSDRKLDPKIAREGADPLDVCRAYHDAAGECVDEDLGHVSWLYHKGSRWQLPFEATDPSAAAAAASSSAAAAAKTGREESAALMARGVKPKVARRWGELVDSGEVVVSAYQQKLFALLHSYADVLLARPMNLAMRRETLRVCLLHAADHVLRARDNELAHTARANTARIKGARRYTIPADQGFTRARVLVLQPFRSSCWDAVNMLVELLPSDLRRRVESAPRFKMQYYEDGGPPQLRVPRPRDYDETFRGNTDDCFYMGVALTRSSVRLFAPLLDADFIFASPLGLKLLVGDEHSRARNTDALTSIELVVVEHADALLMQNWEHTTAVVRALNKLPQSENKTDFSRVRPWFLDGRASLYRQTVVLAQTMMPELAALCTLHCHNTLPKVRALHLGPPALASVARRVRQVFQRVDTRSAADQADDRFAYFAERVLPHLAATENTHTVVYVASYFDYVRLRNLFRHEAVSFCAVCEHTEKAQHGKIRELFAAGRRDFMLYTERFHYYHRYRIRGAHNAVFYGLPTYPDFYHEIVNCLAAPDATVLALYTPGEHYQLERIVGTKRAQRLLDSPKGTHLFC